MTDKEAYITQEGYERLKKELEDLKNNKRKEIANRIQEAKELGDLSENAEYAEAKNEQAFIEGRVIQLENLLKNVTIIESNKTPLNKNIVQVGSVIELKTGNRNQTYTIVGSNEADPESGKISNESPLGQAFLGRKIGEQVEVAIPAGKVTYTITNIK
ncbi:MAG: transcription elongation factor GreA [Patescibacteria group bacterium]|nr:transcription elongation factor GreA [Patescibacteria group bacterium]